MRRSTIKAVAIAAVSVAYSVALTAAARSRAEPARVALLGVLGLLGAGVAIGSLSVIDGAEDYGWKGGHP